MTTYLNRDNLERALLAKLSVSPSTFVVDIHEDDEMYLFGLEQTKNAELTRLVYFRQGAEILDTVRQIAKWKFKGLSNVPSFLDFACGYGRFTRYLIQEVAPSRVWAADIYTKAVEFQRQRFGVNSFASATEPAALVCEARFDMIFVASLFTHLPEQRFEQWLRKLYSLLKPNGILVFSVHDEGLAGNRPMPPSGFLFFPSSESRTLDLAEYGVSFVTEKFMRGMIQRAVGKSWPYQRVQRALCGAHDIYIITKNHQEDYSSFRYQFGPVGYVDSFQVSDLNELRISGWAGDPNENTDIREVQVIINDSMIHRCPVNRLRPDVAAGLGVPKYAASGWEFVCPLQDVASQLDDIVEVRAVSTDGTSTLLHLAAIKTGRDHRAAA